MAWMPWRRKLCQFGLAIFFSALCVGLFGMSFYAASSISGAWVPVDYWLVFFVILTFICGCVCVIAAIIATATFLDGICP